MDEQFPTTLGDMLVLANRFPVNSETFAKAKRFGLVGENANPSRFMGVYLRVNRPVGLSELSSQSEQ